MPFTRVEITSLHHPISAQAVVLAEIEQYQGLEVTIPLNDSRTAGLSVSIYDGVCQYLSPFDKMLRVYYQPTSTEYLVYWGIINSLEWDAASGRVQINSVDLSLKLIHQYLRSGDDALNSDDKRRGLLTLDYRGMFDLLQGGYIGGAQHDRDVPELGILPGTQDTISSIKMEVERGQEIWSTMKQMVDHVPGPDIDLRPVDNVTDTYAYLDCHDHQGTDKTASISFECGFGLNNAKNMKLSPGQIMTHCHALDADGKHRRTAWHYDSSIAYGIWVEWDATDYTVNKDTVDVLMEYAVARIQTYGRPLQQFEVELVLDDLSAHHYRDNYIVGDDIHAEVQQGYFQAEMSGRIVEVTLKQADMAGNVQSSVTCIPTPQGVGEVEQGPDSAYVGGD